MRADFSPSVLSLSVSVSSGDAAYSAASTTSKSLMTLSVVQRPRQRLVNLLRGILHFRMTTSEKDCKPCLFIVCKIAQWVFDRVCIQTPFIFPCERVGCSPLSRIDDRFRLGVQWYKSIVRPFRVVRGLAFPARLWGYFR